MQDWIADELRTADLPDARLNKRLALLLDRLSANPSAPLPQACRGDTELAAAYRFFDNPRTTYHNVLAPHHDATLERIRQHQVVLLPQDTTEIDLTRPSEKVGGPLGDERHWGFYAHPLFAFTPDRLPLGTVHAQLWARDPATFRKGDSRKQRPIEDKESLRWLHGYRQACSVAAQAPDTQVICLADSEGDIYEALQETLPQPGRVKARFILRAGQDRCVVGQGKGARLFTALNDAPVLATLTVEVSRRVAKPSEKGKRKKARPARQAQVSVRSGRVTLRGVKRPGGKLEDLEVTVVVAREESPPAGQEPVQWVLLTDLEVASKEQAVAVVNYYGVRWCAEVLFFILKSGCKIEERQLEHLERMEVCLAVYLIVAWRVAYVTMLGRREPGSPCTVAFGDDEWQAAFAVVRGEVPAEVPTLGEMVGVVAQLGGHIERAKGGPAGPKVMWRGLVRLMDLAACWRAFGPGAAAAGRPAGRPAAALPADPPAAAPPATGASTISDSLHPLLM